MKFLLKLLSIFVLFGTLSLSAFAIDAPMAFKTDSINDTSITLSWDTVDTAYMYYVSYGKTSGVDYINQTDFVEGTGVTIDSLESNSTYYFVVTALDENGDESIYSDEISEDINTTLFSLNSVNVVSTAEIELVFSEPLDTTEGTEREFNIYNKSDKLDSFELLSIDLNVDDNTKLNLTLDREIEIGVEYEVVVIAIKNDSLKNIESGLDSVETFILNDKISETNTGTTSTGANIENVNLNSASDTGTTSTGTNIENVNLNSASDTGTSLAGSNIENMSLNNTTLGAAENTSELPKTGPEHVLMLILSIILAALVFVFKYKKA